MKLILNDRKRLKEWIQEFTYKLDALTDAQIRNEEALRKTDEKFNRLMELLRRRSTNGRK